MKPRLLPAIFSAALLLLVGAATAHAQSFMGLGFLPGFAGDSTSDAISADGTTVVGTCVSATNSANREPFRWTQATGMVALPKGTFSQAFGVSANGSVIAGAIGKAARWTQSSGWVALGNLSGGATISAQGISGDGSVLVGLGTSTPGTQAFRWTQATGTVGLGDLPGGSFYSIAQAVSGDGTTIVGYSDSGGTGSEAFRWTQTTGMVGLGYMSSPSYETGPSSAAFAVSADGSVIVGQADSVDGAHAFRWTQSTGMVDLGGGPGLALATSADGSIVGGEGQAGAFVWDATHGMRYLSSILTTDYHLSDQLDGWSLRRVTGMSADGNVFVGWGINPSGTYEPWIATVPEPPTFLLAAVGMIGLTVFRRRTFTGLCRAMFLCGAALLALACVNITRADIYQWEYVNPADPSQGKQQSTTLCPDGSGVDAAPGVDLSFRNLTMGYFIGANLNGVYAAQSDFTHADFSQATFAFASLSGDFTGASFKNANLSSASLGGTLTGADFTGANIQSANLYPITSAQIYSTASYQAHQLTQTRFDGNDLSGVNMVDQDLTGASFSDAVLVNANFGQANLTSANFSYANLNGANFNQANLVSAVFDRGTVTNVDFSQQDLSKASFYNTTLTGATLTGADVRGTNFQISDVTLAQLYSTASYLAHDLSGINLGGTTLSNANFAAISFTQANFASANLAGAHFSQANLNGASFDGATLTNANFSQADLRNSYVTAASITSANFSGADVRGTTFLLGSTGITAAQLYSTASYQAHDLSGLRLAGDVVGWNFHGQNLTGASFGTDSSIQNNDFGQANLTGASFDYDSLTGSDFTGATIRGAKFSAYNGSVHEGTGIGLAQIYSTASYQLHDLTGIDFTENSLGGGNFANQDLSNSNLSRTILAGANFSNAVLFGANFFDAKFAGIVPAHVPAANFTDADIRGARLGTTDFSFAQLTSTASYQAGNLSGIALNNDNLTGWNLSGLNLSNSSFFNSTLTSANFSHANLSGADLSEASMTSADFTQADVRGAGFAKTLHDGTGITLTQLYSTASYGNHDLSGVRLSGSNLAGANFAGINFSGATLGALNSDLPATLTGADFNHANLMNTRFAGTTLNNVNLTAADARGSDLFNSLLNPTTSTTNFIDGSGYMQHGVNLGAGQSLTVRNHRYVDSENGNSIDVFQSFSMASGGALDLVFDDHQWNSVIRFSPDIAVDRGGTLDLEFASGVDVASQIGRTFDLFDWAGVTPTGTFGVVSPYTWDLSQLYTTGNITLTAVPEPSAFLLAVLGFLAIAVQYCQRRRILAQGARISSLQWMVVSQLLIAPLIAFLVCTSARADVFNLPAGQTGLQVVSVGNAGNLNDPNTGNLYGGVPYNYSIGKYDVTVGQNAAFLNAVAATDTYQLGLAFDAGGAFAPVPEPSSLLLALVGFVGLASCTGKKLGVVS